MSQSVVRNLLTSFTKSENVQQSNRRGSMESVTGSRSGHSDSGERISDIWCHGADERVEGGLLTAEAEATRERIGNIRAKTTRPFLLISQSYFPRTAEDAQIVFEDVQATKCKSPFKLLIIHGKHFHILHACRWSSKCCRCFEWKSRSRPHATHPRFNRLTYSDWTAILKYHLQEGRQIAYSKVSGVEKSYIDVQNNFLSRLRSSKAGSDEGDVDCSGSDDNFIFQRIGCGADSEADELYSISSDQSGAEGPKRRLKDFTKTPNVKRVKRGVRGVGVNQDNLQQFIFAIGKVPMQQIISTKHFMDSEFKYMNVQSSLFQNAMRFARNEVAMMELRDFKKHYLKYTECIWGASSRENISNRYLDLDESHMLLKKLLIYQYHPTSVDKEYEVVDREWKFTVYTKIKYIMEFLDKRHGKKNCWFIISTPNAGKTLFADLIRDYLISSGIIGIWNRENSFPLMNCVGARVILWNEPNFDSGAHSDMLKLFGGDQLNCKVKHQPDGYIEYTPVICTSNYDVFPKKPEFNERIVKEIWQSAPFLIDVKDKRLHPLALGLLFEDCENYFEEDIRLYGVKYTM